MVSKEGSRAIGGFDLECAKGSGSDCFFDVDAIKPT
jgi:hypothetical protein